MIANAALQFKAGSRKLFAYRCPRTAVFVPALFLHLYMIMLHDNGYVFNYSASADAALPSAGAFGPYVLRRPSISFISSSAAV